MISEKQFRARASKLYSSIKARSKPTYWKKGRMKGRMRWQGTPVPHTSEEFLAWLRERVGLNAFLCPYCNAPLDVLSMSLDHNIALKAGGSNCFINLVPCCGDCNNLKSKLTGQDYMQFRSLMRQLSPAAEANILQRLRSGAMGMRLSQQARNEKAS